MEPETGPGPAHMSRDGGDGVFIQRLAVDSGNLPRLSVRRRDSLLLPPESRARELVLEPADPDRGFGLAPSSDGSRDGDAASVKNEASDSGEQPATNASAPETKPKKICCACPDTKKLRDDCIVQNGEDACGKFIEAHLQCLRAEGFNV